MVPLASHQITSHSSLLVTQPSVKEIKSKDTTGPQTFPDPPAYCYRMSRPPVLALQFINLLAEQILTVRSSKSQHTPRLRSSSSISGQLSRSLTYSIISSYDVRKSSASYRQSIQHTVSRLVFRFSSNENSRPWIDLSKSSIVLYHITIIHIAGFLHISVNYIRFGDDVGRLVGKLVTPFSKK